MNYIKDKLFRKDVKNPYKQNASLFHEVLGEYMRRCISIDDNGYHTEESVRKRVVDYWNDLPDDAARLDHLALWSCVGIHFNKKVNSDGVVIDLDLPLKINLKWSVFRDGSDFETGLYEFLDAKTLKQDSFIIDMMNKGELSFRASLEFLQQPRLISIVEDEYMLFKKPLADIFGRVDLFWIALKKNREGSNER